MGMRTNTAIQLRGGGTHGNVLIDVSDPTDISEDESVERLSLDIGAADFDLLERFAAYRNALASAQQKKLKRKWSRKSVAESLLAAQVAALRQQIAQMVADLGPIPSADPKHRDEMEKYARRVLAWDKKNR